MNTTTKRFPRTSQAEPWRGVIEHYRAPLLHRWWRPLSYLLCFGTFALIGALMAWRG